MVKINSAERKSATAYRAGVNGRAEANFGSGENCVVSSIEVIFFVRWIGLFNV
jgi:hypothetical protein